MAVDDQVLTVAASLAPRRLRALEPIHLASGLSLGGDPMLVDDRDLGAAAEAAGMAAVAPGR